MYVGFVWLRAGTGGGVREHDNEPSRSLIGGDLLASVSDCQLFKDSAVSGQSVALSIMKYRTV